LAVNVVEPQVPVTLPELIDLLRLYAAGAIPASTVHERLRPVLAADPLDVAASDPTPWDTDHEDARLFWRLVYLMESEDDDSPELQDLMRRIIASLDSTRSAATTHELFAVIVDQPRLCTIVRRHHAGTISRTGFLSVIAESGYPDHIKLWLEHASSTVLERLCSRLEAGAYDVAAAAFEVPPA
jgi:hypothetical protein